MMLTVPRPRGSIATIAVPNRAPNVIVVTFGVGAANTEVVIRSSKDIARGNPIGFKHFIVEGSKSM